MTTLSTPQVYRWTRHEYNRMAQLGFFAQKRVELIEGQIVVTSPMGSPHATAIALAARTVEPVFGPDYFVRWQMPFGIGDISEPEPDLAVIKGTIRDYTYTHPTSAALIIEVADSSLAYDRETKSSLYARAGVADYWIINLLDRQLEVYRQPLLDAVAPSGFRYLHKTVLRPGDTIAPLDRPDHTLAVADVLP